MTLQERIARATCLWGDCPGPHACQKQDLVCGKFSLNRALRVMAAIREPDEAMLNGARDWSIAKYGAGQGIGNEEAIGCWKAMLSAREEGE